MSLGRNILFYRKYRNKGVKNLSALTGINYSLLYQYERGVRKPSYKVVNSITQVLEVPIGCLLDRENIETDCYERKSRLKSRFIVGDWNLYDVKDWNLSDDEITRLFQEFLKIVENDESQNKTKILREMIINTIAFSNLSDETLNKIEILLEQEKRR